MHAIAKKKFNASKKLLRNNVKLIILVWTKIRAKLGQRMQRDGRNSDKDTETTCIIWIYIDAL